MAQQNDKQKQLLTEVMNADAKDGLYDHIGEPNKMVSAVEWLAIQLYKKMNMSGDGRVFDALLIHAKQMEKQQHGKTWDKALDAYEERGHLYIRAWTDFDEYYNETYGGNNE